LGGVARSPLRPAGDRLCCVSAPNGPLRSFAAWLVPEDPIDLPLGSTMLYRNVRQQISGGSPRVHYDNPGPSRTGSSNFPGTCRVGLQQTPPPVRSGGEAKLICPTSAFRTRSYYLQLCTTRGCENSRRKLSHGRA